MHVQPVREQRIVVGVRLHRHEEGHLEETGPRHGIRRVQRQRFVAQVLGAVDHDVLARRPRHVWLHLLLKRVCRRRPVGFVRHRRWLVPPELRNAVPGMVTVSVGVVQRRKIAPRVGLPPPRLVLRPLNHVRHVAGEPMRDQLFPGRLGPAPDQIHHLGAGDLLNHVRSLSLAGRPRLYAAAR